MTQLSPNRTISQAKGRQELILIININIIEDAPPVSFKIEYWLDLDTFLMIQFFRILQSISDINLVSLLGATIDYKSRKIRKQI